eukprot:2630335-Pleurochrysis_carterae.AAC.2
MLAICGSRDLIFFIDAAVTERFLQTGSLRTYLEEEADLGAEAGGKLRSAILTGFGFEGIMVAVRAMALVCESAFWMLLHARLAPTRTSSTCCRRYGRRLSPSLSRLLPRLRL